MSDMSKDVDQGHDRDVPRYDIAELAELGGVNRRTVRYYVQRGLLPAPTGTGRGRHYTRAHLERLVYVRQQQEAGIPLALIEAALGLGGGAATGPPVGPPGARRTPAGPGPPAAPPAELSRWTRVVVSDGVELHVRGTLPDEARLRAAVQALHAALDGREGGG
jgi:DNA-binding transcriptional MerR regulator